MQSLCAQTPVAHDGNNFRRVSSVVSRKLSAAGAFAQGHTEALPVSAEKRVM